MKALKRRPSVLQALCALKMSPCSPPIASTLNRRDEASSRPPPRFGPVGPLQRFPAIWAAHRTLDTPTGEHYRQQAPRQGENCGVPRHVGF
jgi:hypothetical protein